MKKTTLVSQEDWDGYFSPGGEWEKNQGRLQSKKFARYFCKHTRLRKDSRGTLLDCGCALGDGTQVLYKHFNNMRVFGCDFSRVAIERSISEYGNNISFFESSIYNIKGTFDVIYTSNTLEHFADFAVISRQLIQKCRTLSILVPYDEKLDGKDLYTYNKNHHIVTFRENSFDFLIEEKLATGINSLKFKVPGAWSWNFINQIKQPLLNRFRGFLGQNTKINPLQILYEIKSSYE